MSGLFALRHPFHSLWAHIDRSPTDSLAVSTADILLRQTEIDQTDMTLRIEEHILWLEIPECNVQFVQMT